MSTHTEFANSNNVLHPKLKVSSEESTDEGSTSSDNESAVVPVAKSNHESFSRSALRARGEATLARIQQQAKSQSEAHEAATSPAPTDRTHWSHAECTTAGTQWAHTEGAQWVSNLAGESHWSNDTFESLLNCESCPWEFKTGAKPPGTGMPWGNSAMAFAALSQPLDTGITQTCENDPIFQLLERRSSGHPVKVQLPQNFPASLPKQLDVGVPVKKRPPFPECGGSYKALDPSFPAKKRVPKFLLEARI